jgi:elongation factor P hydroxylase
MTAAHSASRFCARQLERVFARCFEREFRTVLRGGYPEPLYRPGAGEKTPACIAYRADYFASALHEVAHWCIAGEKRRLMEDYGYWYAPDGRDASQQEAFEAVEYKPQALEWVFSRACGHAFSISLDNLSASVQQLSSSEQFKQRVYGQVLDWQRDGLPGRANCFFAALTREYGAGAQGLSSFDFDLAELG